MKKSLKSILCAFLAASAMLSLAACGTSSGGSTASGAASTPAGSSGGAVYELAVVTDANSIDDRGFNQGAWEGLAKYAEENNITHQYYRPIDQSTDGYLVAIESAVNNGAKLVVCPGYLFEAAVYKAQDMYPDVSFIILDGTPQDGTYTDYKTADNTYSIVFAEEQAGFLAGYAAVKDGYRDLGFFGAMATAISRAPNMPPGSLGLSLEPSPASTITPAHSIFCRKTRRRRPPGIKAARSASSVAARPTMFLRRVNQSAAIVSRSASIWTSRQALKRSSLPR